MNKRYHRKRMSRKQSKLDRLAKDKEFDEALLPYLHSDEEIDWADLMYSKMQAEYISMAATQGVAIAKHKFDEDAF
eukprot:12887039-Prorocentrum_lima.AAC.1